MINPMVGSIRVLGVVESPTYEQLEHHVRVAVAEKVVVETRKLWPTRG